MLALKVWIDGERVCLAGVEDWAVLSAHVTACRAHLRRDSDDLDVSVGAMSEGDEGALYHSRWLRRALKLGSTVMVKLVETDEPGEPIRRYRSDSEVQEPSFTDEELEEIEREEYLRLKAKFEVDG